MAAEGSKLFLGIDASAYLSPLAYEVAKLPGKWKQDNPHLTVQFCGRNITDQEVNVVRERWQEALAAADLTQEDMRVDILSEFDMFGPNNDVLVVKCRVSPAFTRAVATGRRLAKVGVASIPASDFDFSPHITLGTAEAVPDPATVPAGGFGSFSITEITMWGDPDKKPEDAEKYGNGAVTDVGLPYTVRGTIALGPLVAA